jgi:hypothetical protein
MTPERPIVDSPKAKVIFQSLQASAGSRLVIEAARL